MRDRLRLWAYANVPLARQLLVELETPVGVRLAAGPSWYGLRTSHPPAPLPLPTGPRGDAMRADGDANTERVQYFDPVRRLPSITMDAGVLLFELTRVQVPSHAVTVVQRLATWLRITAVGADPASTIEYFGGPSLGKVEATPFPYPLVHPLGGELSAEWCLIRQRFGDTSTQPPMVFAGAENELPADQTLVGPWRDHRYGWDSQYSDDNNWVTGGRSLLRLFLKLTVTGAPRWTVLAAGRIGGWYQQNGALGAGLDAATTRH